ncbi:hypothetical protein M2440_001819 [Methylorubrum extorquens]|nr:hypothetical protein [Methylorubrum extorquens]
MADERILTSLAIPEPVWDTVRASWHRRDPSLYGRLDFSYGGMGPAKLLEYNADTPTALYETAVFQWLWLEQGLKEGRLPAGSDQFNALHERLIARLAEIAPPGLIAFAADTSGPEDLGTAGYLQDCAVQAGCATILLDLAQVGLRADGAFCGPDEQPFAALFKLYPWEWAFQDAFGSAVAASPTRFLEPPWKMVLSNKGLLAHLWACEPGHPNLLPAFFEADPANATLGNAYVRKPLLSREGANVEIFFRWRSRRRSGWALRRGRLHPPGCGGAALLRRPPPAPGRLDRRGCAGRTVYPRIRRPDHRRRRAVRAAPDRTELTPVTKKGPDRLRPPRLRSDSREPELALAARGAVAAAGAARATAHGAARCVAGRGAGGHGAGRAGGCARGVAVRRPHAVAGVVPHRAGTVRGAPGAALAGARLGEGRPGNGEGQRGGKRDRLGDHLGRHGSFLP